MPIMQFSDTITIIISIIVAISTVGAVAFGIVWNTSRRFSNIENDAKARKENHINDINTLKIKIEEIDKNNIQKYSDSKIERKEEIAKELSNQIGKFDVIQKQIDASRSDIKQVASTVTEVNTKVEYIERQIEELKQCDIENKRFFEKWIQRKEDDIKGMANWIKEIMAFILGKKMMMDRDANGSTTNGG